MKDKIIEKAVEAICEKGCLLVREDIVKLQSGQTLAETEGLNCEQSAKVLKELKAIMSVYGDTCRTDGKLAGMTSREIDKELKTS